MTLRERRLRKQERGLCAHCPNPRRLNKTCCASCAAKDTKRNNAYRKERRKVDINRLQQDLRVRLYGALLNNQRAGSAVRDLGCSIPDFREYFERLFKPGMSWDNHGEWHIDHIVPLALFDLTNRQQFLRACHYTNLQPLWSRDNLSKGDNLL